MERYRIMNRTTGEWWEGEAETAQEACRLAGWEVEICHIRQRSAAGYGGWKKPDNQCTEGGNEPWRNLY